MISSGFAEVGDADTEAQLAAAARRHGMRLVGPNCFGIVNTHPSVRMNATFAPVAPIRVASGSPPSRAAWGSSCSPGRRPPASACRRSCRSATRQTSAPTISSSTGTPIPTPMSCCCTWSRSGTRGSSRGIARHVARHKPVLVLKSGRTVAGFPWRRVAHCGARRPRGRGRRAVPPGRGRPGRHAWSSCSTRRTLMVHQPLPAGPRVAIVSNGGGPGILAADACVAAGLEVPELSGPLQEALRACAPSGRRAEEPGRPRRIGGRGRVRAALRSVLAVRRGRRGARDLRRRRSSRTPRTCATRWSAQHHSPATCR